MSPLAMTVTRLGYKLVRVWILVIWTNEKKKEKEFRVPLLLLLVFH